MNTRPLVIYHSNCADGFSAAWCFWRKYGTEADYHAGVYQQDPPDVAGRDVYLVDFSYKRPVVEAMLRQEGFPAVRRTSILEGTGRFEEAVLLLDTVGELPSAYAAAPVVACAVAAASRASMRRRTSPASAR